MTALQYADSLEAEQQAALLDDLSHEYYLTGHIEEAIDPCEAALAIWRALGHQERIGHDLRRLSRLTWLLGRVTEAERLGMSAVDMLETLPPSQELAMAYGNLSHLHMLQSDTAHAVLWGERAIELAEQLQDIETLSYALNNVGSAQLDDGDDGGWAQLERSLQVALEQGYEEHVARAYSQHRRQYGGAPRLRPRHRLPPERSGLLHRPRPWRMGPMFAGRAGGYLPRSRGLGRGR